MARPVSISGFGNDNCNAALVPTSGNVQKRGCLDRILGVLEKLALPILAGIGICSIMLVCGLPIAVSISVGVGISLLVLGVLAARWANIKTRESLNNEPPVTYRT